MRTNVNLVGIERSERACSCERRCEAFPSLQVDKGVLCLSEALLDADVAFAYFDELDRQRPRKLPACKYLFTE